jgi:FkbM family methyltransferase
VIAGVSVMWQPAFVAAQRAYSVMLRARYGRSGMPWRVHDETIRIDPRRRHLVPHASEETLYRFIQHEVAPGDAVLDVGSFLGIYAILEARRAGPAGRVIALEPTAWSAAIARRHFSYNAEACASITLIEAAAGERRGRATFYEYEQPYVNALAAAVDVAGVPVRREVEVISLDDVCRELRVMPTLIRMDVQGAEFHALRGAREVIRAAGPRLRIVAEMHPQCWPGFDIDATYVRDTISLLGLEATPLEPGAELFARDGHVVFRPAGVRA